MRSSRSTSATQSATSRRAGSALQPEVDASLGAQGRATPPETPESSLELETRQETEAEGASNDVDEATSLHDQAVEVTLATP